MLLGKSILQIPEPRPTELLTVEFSLLERKMYQGNREQLSTLREMAKTSDIPRGKLHNLFNYLRYFTSHPALVEPAFYLSSQESEANHAAHPAQDATQPDPQKTRVRHIFCRMCSNVLVEPLVGEVRCPPHRESRAQY